MDSKIIVKIYYGTGNFSSQVKRFIGENITRINANGYHVSLLDGRKHIAELRKLGIPDLPVLIIPGNKPIYGYNNITARLLTAQQNLQRAVDPARVEEAYDAFLNRCMDDTDFEEKPLEPGDVNEKLTAFEMARARNLAKYGAGTKMPAKFANDDAFVDYAQGGDNGGGASSGNDAIMGATESVDQMLDDYLNSTASQQGY